MELNQSLNRYKNFVFNFTVLLVFVFVAFKIYGWNEKKLLLLQEKKQNEEKKNELLEIIKNIEKKVFSYKRFLNNKDITTLISSIGSLANKSQVKILSIKPSLEENYTPYLLRYPLELVVQADSYHHLGGFLAELESHPDMYVVELLNLEPSSREIGREEKKEYKLKANLKISTFLYK